MHFKATIRAAASSYLGSASAAATGLLSIRLATQLLSKEEFGLWSFTMQTVGYFMLLDLGVASSITRLLGDPLAARDQKKIDSWFTLSLMTLAGQAVIILVAGLALRPYVLKWFEIPAHLIGQASDLWLAFLAIQAIGLVFRVLFAILHAQNRVYWTSNLQILGSWVGLAAFFLMLTHGWGVLAYAWSSGMSMLVISIGGILAVRRGGVGFGLSLVGVTRNEVRRMFSFASALFALGLASQVYFASQGLVVTKLLGLEAAAILAVTNRGAAIAIGSIGKPFDAFSPRWQVAYCADDHSSVAREFRLMTRFTLLAATAAAVAVALINQPFVLWWTKPDYFGGLSLSLLLCAFLVIQAVNRCFITPFVLSLRVRAYTLVNLAGVTMAIGFMILLTSYLGLPGIPLGLIVADLLFPVWYYIRKGGACFGVNGPKLLLADLHYIIPAVCAAVALAFFLPHLTIASSLTWLLIACACASAICFPLLWRAWTLMRQLRHT